MILTSLKNFGKSIGYYFIPIGVIAFAVLLYLAVAIPACVSSIETAFKAISAELSETSFDWNHIQSVLVSKFFEYNESGDAMSLLTDTNKLVGFLKDVAKEAFGLPELSSNLTAIIEKCVAEIGGYIFGLIGVLVVSIFLSIVILNIILRKYLTETNIFKSILVSLLNGLLVVILIYIVWTVYNKVNLAVAIVVLVGLILVSIVVSLLEAYLFYGKKYVPFKEVFNMKNLVGLIVGELLDLAIGLAIIIGVSFIPNLFAVIVIELPLVELLLCVLALNADVYTAELAREHKRLEQSK